MGLGRPGAKAPEASANDGGNRFKRDITGSNGMSRARNRTELAIQPAETGRNGIEQAADEALNALRQKACGAAPASPLRR